MKLNKGIARMPMKLYLAKEPLRRFKYLMVFIFILLPNLALGAETAEGVLSIIHNGLLSWMPLIKKACLWVFWTLVVIDLVWTFGLKALSGFEFGDFLATLIKKIMYIGIFLFLFNVDYWLHIIFNSFSQLATGVNNGISITPQNIIEQALNLVGKYSIYEFLESWRFNIKSYLWRYYTNCFCVNGCGFTYCLFKIFLNECNCIFCFGIRWLKPFQANRIKSSNDSY